MNWRKLKPRPHAKLAGSIALVLVSFTSLPLVQAQLPEPLSSIRFVPPPPPQSADRGAPTGRQQGGASRGQCPAGNKPLTALVPATQHLNTKQQGDPAWSMESVWGLTVTEHPTLWFYIPYTLTPEFPIEFVLQDEQDNEIYKTSFTPSKMPPGIMRLPLHSTEVSLEVGKMYHWYFMINCDPDAPHMVEGWVQQHAVNPLLASQLKQATPRQRVALYAANGIWYDALTTLAEFRSVNLKEPRLSQDWANLLQSVGLEAIASEPIRQCCLDN